MSFVLLGPTQLLPSSTAGSAPTSGMVGMQPGVMGSPSPVTGMWPGVPSSVAVSPGPAMGMPQPGMMGMPNMYGMQPGMVGFTQQQVMMAMPYQQPTGLMSAQQKTSTSFDEL